MYTHYRTPIHPAPGEGSSVPIPPAMTKQNDKIVLLVKGTTWGYRSKNHFRTIATHATLS
jgi:hypothetical protein